MSESENYQKASEIRKSGLGAMPCLNNKRPIIKGWQNKISDNIFKGGDWKGLIGISISASDDPMECIDFDTKHDIRGGIYDAFQYRVKELGGEYLLKEVYIQQTLSGGFHLVYKTDEKIGEGNQKLTTRKESAEAVIETRGEGGQFIYYHEKVIQGEIIKLPTFTIKERNLLIQAARDLDEAVAPKSGLVAKRERSGGEPLTGSSPLDLYNADTDFHQLLEHYQWTFSHEQSDIAFYVRPGKDSKDGHSGTLYKNDGIFVNFSSSVNLPTEKGMTAAAFLANMEGISFSDLTHRLMDQGYGDKKVSTPTIGRLPEPEQGHEPEPEPLPRLGVDFVKGSPPLIQKIVRLSETPLEKEVGFLSALAGISGILPGVWFNYGGDKFYLNTMTYILGPSGSGKGPMNRIKYALNIVNDWYQENALNKFELSDEGVRQDENGNEVDADLLSIFVPGDISSAAMMEALDANGSQGILFETEADPLADSMGQDWGAGVSTTIRKAFSHEGQEVGRKTGKKKIILDEIKLTILLSSTQGQFKRLLKSHENGTFSRLSYYFIPRVKEFTIPRTKKLHKESYKEIGNDLLNIYKKLFDSEMEVRISDHQLDLIEEWGQNHKDALFESEDGGLDATVHRFGVTVTRFAALRCVLNHYDLKSNSFNQPSFIFELSDHDIAYGAHICDVLVEHAKEAIRSLSSLQAKNDRDEYIYKHRKAGRSFSDIATDVSMTRQGVRKAYERIEAEKIKVATR